MKKKVRKILNVVQKGLEDPEIGSDLCSILTALRGCDIYEENIVNTAAALKWKTTAKIRAEAFPNMIQSIGCYNTDSIDEEDFKLTPVELAAKYHIDHQQYWHFLSHFRHALNAFKAKDD